MNSKRSGMPAQHADSGLILSKGRDTDALKRILKNRLSALKRLMALTALLIGGCSTPGADQDANKLRELTILYTNDEHGWMEGMEPHQSAAHLFQLWREQEGYSEEGPFLILSGGDNWTGPAISTWSEGRSMVEVMNAMQYDASAVGNHEFDFGLDVIKARAEEADFPYLSANTRWRSNGLTPTELGILPYTVTTVNDIRVGIVGLTTLDTPTATNPDNVRELNFLGYERALRETLPALEAEDTDINLVIAHVCQDPLEQLIYRTQDLDIALFGAGHCNELIARQVQDTVLLGGGFHFTAYATATFSVDLTTSEIRNLSLSARNNEQSAPDRSVASIVSGWAEQTEAILSEEIAFSARTLPRQEPELGQIIVGSWLLADSSADVAITNAGGIRTDLPAGKIDVGTLVSMMPFDNSIIALDLDGHTIRRALETGARPIVGGLHRAGSDWILTRRNEPLDDGQIYRVLVNSFMYAGGDDYEMIAEADPDGFDTGINYRQPFQDWLKSQESSNDNPLLIEP